MQMRTRTGTKQCKNVDIHTNPDNPGRSRIPYHTDDYVIDDFLKNEIMVAKLCACPSCSARRIVLRRLQEIFLDWKRLKRAEEARIKDSGCCCR